MDQRLPLHFCGMVGMVGGEEILIALLSCDVIAIMFLWLWIPENGLRPISQ